PRYASLPSCFFTTSCGDAAYFAGNAVGADPPNQFMTLFSCPLFTGSLSPVDSGVPVQAPPAAAWTWARMLESVALWPGTTLAHAAVFPPTVELPELLMNVTVAPQPSEVGPPKKHELSAMGNTQEVGGGVTGWVAHAMASPAAGRLANPSSRRNVMDTVVW